jgi:hypothetical protein
MPNLAKPKCRALLVGDNCINKIRYKSTGSDDEISETSATVMLDF